ncbi:site-2 protease family protein [Sinomonas sp. JGH33]|uniref:Site-2 protease family protein n=1 Tax=Sinomonas terricola TaxID=3110330 RepID=A0ABU5T4Y7_9MICC|nr:site-2 protease family protein [Sinomonas sp. JGH33]MEA5454602.1 site-2 protease family protein [Sinomonas sp. JGH33]
MNSTVLFILGVLFVAIGIAVSIALHEIGHLLPAKLFNVRVTRYMIGFGPTIWSTRKGETEYGIKALPLGGYVQMVGMYPPNRRDGSVRQSSTGIFQGLAEAARDQAHEEVRPEDHGRLFYQLPVWKKIIIMLGGPAMNILLGILFTAIVLMGFGIPQPTNQVASVSACMVASNEQTPTDTSTCTKTPAAAAGLKPGDTVIRFDGKDVTGWDQLASWIRASAGKTVGLTVKRGDGTVDLTITPVLNTVAVFGPDGQPAKNADGSYKTTVSGFIGIGSKQAATPQPATSVLPAVGENIAQVSAVIVNLPARVVGVAQAAFSSAPRDPNGPISVVGVGRVAGEVAALEDVPLSARIATLVSILAGVNLALAVFNLVPLLPLDGGHVAGALYEGVRRRIAKWLKKPDPGPFDIAKLLPLTYAVASVLIVMSVLLIYADIVKPVKLFG